MEAAFAWKRDSIEPLEMTSRGRKKHKSTDKRRQTAASRNRTQSGVAGLQGEEQRVGAEVGLAAWCPGMDGPDRRWLTRLLRACSVPSVGSALSTLWAW